MFPSQEPLYAPAPIRRRRATSPYVFLVLGILAFAICIAYIGVGVTRILNGALSARTAIAAAQISIADTDFSEASENLTVAHDGLVHAQSGAAMISFVSYFPWLGQRYDAGVAVLNATEKTVDVLKEAMTIAVDIYAVVEEARATLAWQDPARADQPLHDMPPAVKAELFTRLANALPDLRTMQVKLALAEDDIARFHELPVSGNLASLITPFEEILTKLKSGVDFLVPFAGITRELAGIDGDRQFLLMFMNDTELRPTGGFLGTYGLVVIRGGDMKSLTTDDTYAVDALVMNNPSYVVTSPTPIAKYLEQPIWYFRDGTWSPDFPSGARDTIALLRQEIAASGQPVPDIHGAIGITTTFFKDLLRFLGPITVDGKTYTADNVVDTLEYQVEIAFEQQGVTRADRKDIVGHLTNEILDQVLELPPSRLEDVFALLERSFAKKELAMWMREDDTQAVLDDAGWSQRVTNENAVDTLMVIDANMASLKSDPVVHRTIDYSITPSGAGYQATVAITYDHQGSFDWKTSRYRTYTRVFVPEGSGLLSVEGSLANDAIRNPQRLPGEVITESEFGLTSFGTFTSVEPGQKQTLTFTYTVPSAVVTAIQNGTYTLRVLKQMGADAYDLLLDLDFNKSVRKAAPSEDVSAWGDDTYTLRTELDENKEIRVDF
ncbi:MAG: DUF4012 domain-containing protein [Patescibacteria group bacterium]